MTIAHYSADASEPLDFYGGPFSNFARSTLFLRDPWGIERMYPTVEHYFQAWKAATPEDHDYVLAIDDCWQCKGRGRAVKLRPDWEQIKYEVMLTALRAKFALPEYRKILLATGEREIREDSPTDFVWGYRSGGTNLLGKALMQVRAEIPREPLPRAVVENALADAVSRLTD